MKKGPEALKELGNDQFKRGDTEGALKLYAEAISLLAGEDTATLRSTLFANQALCFLKLGDGIRSLQASEESLLADSSNIKALFRKCKALFELERYEDFLQAFRGVPSNTPDYQKLLSFAKLSDTAIKQRLGQYDLASIEFDPLKQHETRVQTYIGPIEIRDTAAMGRGLFVTRTVKAGELLLAELALVNTCVNDGVYVDRAGEEWSGQGGLRGYYEWDERNNLRHREMALRRVRAIVSADKVVAAKLAWLYREGSPRAKRKAPDIHWYLPAWHPLHAPVPIGSTAEDLTEDDIRAVLCGNQFSTERVIHASARVRECVLRTLRFFCSDMAALRSEEQTLQPATTLQAEILRRASEDPSGGKAGAATLRNVILAATDQVNAADHLGCTALHYAVMLRDAAALQELLRVSSLNLSALDRLGFSALHYAADQYFDPATLRLLLAQENIDVNVVKLQWRTPLALACSSRQLEAVRLLLEHGADPTVSHPYPLLGACPLDDAIEARDTELLRLFAEAGRHPSSHPLKRISAQRDRRVGLGLWLVMSFCNHSEAPNTVRMQVGDLVLVYAERDLSAGQEIFIRYSQNDTALRDKWHVDI